MTTDPLAQLVVALVVELRTVVRDEVRAAMQSRAPTEVMSVREAAAFARVGQARIRSWVATGRLARLGTGPVRVRRADVEALLQADGAAQVGDVEAAAARVLGRVG